MATTTPNYGLRKPGYADRADVITDIAANMDLLDEHDHNGIYVGVNTQFIDVANYASPQAAINASNFGDLIYFRDGTYLVSSTLELKKGRRYVGANRETTVIKMANGANLDAVAASEAWLSTSATVSDNPISIENLTFDGNKANQASGDGHGLALITFWETVDNVIVQNCRGNGIHLTSERRDGTEIAGSAGVEPHLHRVFARACDGNGIRIFDPTATTQSVTDGWIVDCVVSGCANDDGIRIDSGSGWTIYGCHLYTCEHSGIHVGRADSVRIIGNYIESWGYTDTPGSYAAIMLGNGGSTFIAATNPLIVANNTGFRGTGFAVGSNLYGIRIAGSAGSTSRITLTGNAMYGGDGFHTGLSVAHQDGTATTKLRMAANQFDGWANSMVLTSTGAVTVSGDTFKTLATAATTGFNRLPGMPGVPTGTPESTAEGLPVVVDTATKRLHVYSGGAWVPMSPAGPSNAVSSAYLRPTAALAENFSRLQGISNVAALTSGTLRMVAFPLPAGLLVSSVSFRSGGTALVTGTNQWAALFNESRELLAVSADATNAAWAANATKTFTFTSPHLTTYSGLFYVGLMVAAATPPTLFCVSGQDQLNNLAPIIGGNSNTSQTTPPTAPFTATAITAGGGMPYAWVS